MRENIIIAGDEIALFCRLQMHTRKDIPIRSSEMGVLIYIQKQKEGVTPLMISNFFQISKPSVTTMINELVKKNYLVKTSSQTDRRSYIVSITEKGLGLVLSTQDEYFKLISILEDKMGEKEFGLLVELIQKANNILGEERK